ncbi:MAG TPA: type II toxin-antitoxin system VapC family toxin [Terriglobales bacterium]|nr:type II toxin-antitoxin system VapC family toxin [Terriglobales bacterium]
MILADTDVLIDYLAGTQPATDQVLAYAESDSLQTSAITCFELLTGARNGKRGDAVRRLVGAIPVLPLDREAATRAADVRQRLARSGVSIAMADSLIAGIALVNNLPLLTRNRKHFESVEGLRLVPLRQSTN